MEKCSPPEAGQRANLLRRGTRLRRPILLTVLVVTALACLVDGPFFASSLTLKAQKLETAAKRLRQKLEKAEKSLRAYTTAQDLASKSSSDKKKEKYEKKAAKHLKDLSEKREGLRKYIADLEKTMGTVRGEMERYSDAKRSKAEDTMRAAEELVLRLRSFLHASSAALEGRGGAGD